MVSVDWIDDYCKDLDRTESKRECSYASNVRSKKGKLLRYKGLLLPPWAHIR